MKNKYLFLPVFMTLLATSSCDNIIINSENVSSSEENNVSLTEYDTFFDINSKIEINIKMSQSELEKLNNDYTHYLYNGGKSPLYRSCDVSIKFADKQYDFSQVGIRMKGNTSRRNFLDSNGQINDLIHYKLDFAQTFSDDYYDNSTYTLTQEKDERKERTFLGMEKLDLKWNKNFDATHIKQLYAYKMFNAFDVLSLNMNLGKVSLQIDDNPSKTLGVFEVLEVIDKLFIKRYFDENQAGGDLYKVGYTSMGKGDLTINNLSNTIGVEDEDSSYFPIYDLKTNKKTSDNSSLKNLIYHLNSSSVSKESLNEYIDMESFLMEEAVAYVLGNPDDLRNNYNNYYIYFNKENNKATFMPYDWDRCLGITKDWDPTNSAMTGVKFNSNYAQGANENQRNPLVRYTLGRDSVVINEYNETFKNNIKKIFKSKWSNPEYFNSFFEIAKNNYQNDVIPEYELIANKGIVFENVDDGIDTNMSFNEYISKKRNTFYSSINENDPGCASI